MKRALSVTLALVAVALFCIAAAPTFSHYSSALNSVTINNQYTGAWDTVGSVITVHTDTCYEYFTVTGTAVMGPNDKLYVAIGNDSCNRVSATDLSPHNNLDTIGILGPFRGQIGETRHSFCYQYRWTSTSTQTDITDTFYVNAACGGSSASEAVALENVLVAVAVGDRD
jgi:hypothetical protein